MTLPGSSPRPGRDRRAARHAGAPGRLRDDSGKRVVVIGGGIAGLAAATALGERGVQVDVLEREDELGGRVRAWPVEHGGEQLSMSRGFHAFFRQYYNLRALLRRTDPDLQRLVPVLDYPLLAASGQLDSFTGLPRTPPLNMAAFMLRSKAFGLRELRSIDTDAAHELITVDFPATFSAYDGQSANAFLDRLRFPESMRHLALEVFSRSFFADPDEFSAGELLAMFHAYFIGSSEGLLFDVPDDDFDTALWAPLRRYLDRIGVRVRTGAPVQALESLADGVLVQSGDETFAADAVVVATDLASTQQLLAGDAVRADDEWRAQLATLRSAPPFAVWRLWLDTRAGAERAPFLGTAGFGCVDNVSLLDRYDAGAAEWARRHRGSVVELHAYALPAGQSDADVRSEMTSVLGRVYPELAGAVPVAQEYLRRQDCPLVDTRPWAERPGVVTPDPRVVLAGDGVRCDYPVALMERAATTGLLAANHLLGQWELAGHDVWTVPLRSRYRRSA